MDYDKFNRLQYLLYQRDILTDISAILYGDDFVEHPKFWGSVTEKQMANVVEEMVDMGWEETYDDEIRNEADRIFRKFFGNLPDEDLDNLN